MTKISSNHAYLTSTRFMPESLVPLFDTSECLVHQIFKAELFLKQTSENAFKRKLFWKNITLKGILVLEHF